MAEKRLLIHQLFIYKDSAISKNQPDLTALKKLSENELTLSLLKEVMRTTRDIVQKMGIFIVSDTKITDGVDSQPVPNIRKEEKNTEKSSTDLAKELTDHIPIEKSVAVNVKAIRTQDEMYGTLLNIKS